MDQLFAQVAIATRRVCLVKFIAIAEWKFRNSSESLAFSFAHSCCSSRISRNFSRVEIVAEKILPQTSFDACILQATLCVHS